MLDIAERVLVAALGLWFTYQLFPYLLYCPTNVMVLISGLLSAVMILIRRPGKVEASGYAWSVALLATFGSLLIRPGGSDWIPPALAMGLMAFGLSISIWAKLALSRSFGLLPANRGVRTEGPYGLIRHPIYLGYLLTEGAYILVNVSANNIVVFICGWSAMLLRIRAEERLLGGDAQYREYRESVRYRLIPGIW